VTLTRIALGSLTPVSLLLTLVAQDAAFAQGRRAVRRAPAPRAGGVVIAAYYRPLFLPPFYSPFYDPWWYPYPFGSYPPYGWYPYPYEDRASVRLQVSPRETEVFVDGYYAGTVDEFDGMFQRLHLEPGEHEITLYLAGHRTVNQKIFLQDRGTFRIRHTMEPLGPGETIRVQPADAEIVIDGERWEGPQDDEALVVQVAPGTHRIEVRKEGYRSYTAEVTVTAARTSPLNISLPRQ